MILWLKRLWWRLTGKRPRLFLNGVELKTWQSATTGCSNHRIDSLRDGVVGFTPGPGDVTIEFEDKKAEPDE